MREDYPPGHAITEDGSISYGPKGGQAYNQVPKNIVMHKTSFIEIN
jgi:hypothetical protein